MSKSPKIKTLTLAEKRASQEAELNVRLAKEREIGRAEGRRAELENQVARNERQFIETFIDTVTKSPLGDDALLVGARAILKPGIGAEVQTTVIGMGDLREFIRLMRYQDKIVNDAVAVGLIVRKPEDEMASHNVSDCFKNAVIVPPGKIAVSLPSKK